MKVVRPEWLLESAKAGELLRWQDFIFRPGDRAEDSQGTKTAQQNLLDVFTSQTSATHASQEDHVVKDFETNKRDHTEVELKEIPEQQNAPKTPPPRLPESSFMQIPPQLTSPERSSVVHQQSHTTVPVTTEKPSRAPKYAAHASNPNAKRAMADPEWRSAHTSAAPDFIEGYYKNSRLHHLATWKAELKGLVAEAQERAESRLTPERAQLEATPLDSADLEREGQTAGSVSMRGVELIMRSPKGKGKAKPDVERVIMHCDFDCFFVSAGLIGRPHLRGKPVVVCHSQGSQGGGSSTSEIASCSYEARQFGVKNGMR